MAVGGPFRQMRIEAWRDCLVEHGVIADAERIESVFDERAAVLDDRWRRGQHYAPEDLLADAAAALGVGDDEVLASLADAQMDAARRAPVQMASGAAGVLRRLRAAGIRLGIVCDVGSTPSSVLRAHLDRHDVLGYFDAFAFSDEVGVYKPDERIFKAALDGMGVDPATAAHVGDLRRTDVAGADALGMITVRYTGLNRDEDGAGSTVDAQHVIDHHDQLPVALGIAT